MARRTSKRQKGLTKIEKHCKLLGDRIIEKAYQQIMETPLGTPVVLIFPQQAPLELVTLFAERAAERAQAAGRIAHGLVIDFE